MNKRRKVQASQANDEDDACRTNFIGKSGRRHLRGRKISSACFANLPLDILFEIFVYLQPIDLLHLARTSKGLRNLLMSRTAEPIWRDAAENVTACPTRPPDVNEPTWTSLVFDTYCHTKGCSKTGIKEPLWHFRKRYCNACKLACTVPVEQAVIRKRAVEEVEQLPLPSCTVSMEVNGHREYIRSVHKPDLVKMKETYHRLNPRKRVQWLGEKAAEAEDIQIHADWCHRWSRNNKCRREEELENIRAEKYEAILANLTQLGWGPEVDFMAQESLFSDTLRRISIVKQAKPLTDRTWPKIYKEILPTLEYLRTKRLRRDRLKLMKTRVDTLRKAVESFQHEYHCIFPQLPNLIHLRTFEDLIRAPSNVPVTLEDFLALRPILPDIVERWKDDCTRHLSETIRVKAGIPDDVDPLQLPVGTYFICECDEFSTSRRAEWPHTMNAILSHEPNFAFLFCIKYDTDPDQMSTSELCAALIHESPWSYRWAEKYNWFIEVVQDLVRMCGGDPLRTTAAELDTFSVRFTCKACLDLNPTHPEVRRVMTWRAAVGHIALCRACLERTYKEAEEKHGQVHMLEVWKPRSKATEEIVLATEEKCRLQAERILNKKTIWYCSHCTPVSKGEKRDQVLQHLRDIHSIENATEDDLYCSPQPSKLEWLRHRPIQLIPDDVDESVLPQKTKDLLSHVTAVRVPNEEIYLSG